MNLVARLGLVMEDQILTQCPLGSYKNDTTPPQKYVFPFMKNWVCLINGRPGAESFEGGDCDKCGRVDFPWNIRGWLGSDTEVQKACTLFCKERPGDAPAMCPRDWKTEKILGHTPMKSCIKQDVSIGMDGERLEFYTGDDTLCSVFSDYITTCKPQGNTHCTYRVCDGNSNFQEYESCK